MDAFLHIRPIIRCHSPPFLFSFKFEYDKEHKDSLEKYPEMRERMYKLLNEGRQQKEMEGGRMEVKISQKIQFSKGIIRCIIKAAKEGDIVEYNGANTSGGFRAFEITPVYGR